MIIAWVILTWNSEACIKKCINAILEIKGYVNRITIIDNGSEDNTFKILEDYSKKYENVKIERLDKNYGTTYPRNLGIKKIEKDANFLCILDSDAYINQNTVETLISVLQNDRKAMIAGPNLQNSSGERQPSARSFPTLTTKIFKACPVKKIELIGRRMESCPNCKSDMPFQADVIMSACWMMKPEIFKKIGYFDEFFRYSPEDTEFCIRVQKAGYKVIFCPTVTVIHDWQRLSKKKIISKINYESLKGHIYMFHKYHFWFTTRNIKKERK